jgi:uncharacterized protein YjdB
MPSDTASGTSPRGRRGASPRLAAGTGLCPRAANLTRGISDGWSWARPRLTAVAGCLAAVAILATCEATTAPRSGHVLLSYTGDTTLTDGVRAAAAVAVTVDGSPYTSPHLILQSSDTTVLAVVMTRDGTDTLVARGLGTATLTIELLNSVLAGPPPTLTKTFLVAPQSVQFVRGTQALGALGDTITVPAQAFDVHGTQIANVPFTWTTSDTLVARVTSKGRITAVTNGSATIRAVVVGDTALLKVTVQQVPAHFSFTPSLPVTLNAFGADTTLSAGALDSLGNAIKGTNAAPTWSLQSGGIVTVQQTGQVQAVGNGTTYVYASHSPAHDSLQMTVAQRATRIVMMAANGLAIPSVGGNLVLTVTAYDRNNNQIATANPTLTSLDPTIAQVSSPTRTVTGLAVGTARIVGTEDLAVDTVLVQVANIPVKLSLSVDSAVMNSVGDTLKLGVTFTNSLGGTVTGLMPAWVSSDTSILSVATQDGRVVAVRQGTARVIATYAGLADTALITVTNAPAVIKLLSHADTLPTLGDTLTLAATIQNSRGASLPPTSVTWSVDNTALATVSPSGTVTSHAVGRTTVRATSGILGDSAALWITNNPARIVLNSTLDTMTARGQMLVYTATVTNKAGQVITGDTVTWTSTNASVASVASGSPLTGVVTALSPGTTSIVAQAGTVTASATVVMRTPTLIYVDNSTLDTLHFGTLKRPYAHIQDGVNAAAPEDTVFVHVGSGPYSEAVALSRDIVLEGDPTAYHAGGNDPTKLPLISHDTGTAGITAITSGRIIIRTLAVRHTLDGAAVYAHGATVALSNVFVNPTADPFNSGRGFYIDSTSTASVDSSKVQTVKGYGIRLHNVNNGSVTRSVATLVHNAQDGTNSAGIEVDYGANDVVSGDLVRWTYGPEVLLDSTASAVATTNNLAGGGQLMRVLGVSGSSQIANNTFNTRAQANDLNPGSSASDGRSGLELNASSGVQVIGNVIQGDTGSTALVDAVRFIGTRSGAYPNLVENITISGGRWGIRSENSTWTLQMSYLHGTNTGVVLSSADTASLLTDTLTTAIADCVQATGTSIRLAVTGGLFSRCGPAGTGAVSVNAPGAVVDVTGDATFVGANQRAVVVAGAQHASVIGNSMAGGSPEGSVNATALVGVIDLQADSVTAVGNAVTGYPSYAALSLAGTTVRADSNFLSQNRVGIEAGSLTAFEASTNDIFDNDTAGVINEDASGVTMPNNWWGDSLGPRGVGVQQAVGDSVVGNVSFQPVAFVPLNAGSRPVSPMRSIRGNGQSASQSTTLPLPLAVRVVDQAGRPVGGVSVTFAVTGGGATLNGGVPTLVQTTNSSGLAEAQVTLGPPGTSSISASSAAGGGVTFTETATP